QSARPAPLGDEGGGEDEELVLLARREFHQVLQMRGAVASRARTAGRTRDHSAANHSRTASVDAPRKRATRIPGSRVTPPSPSFRTRARSAVRSMASTARSAQMNDP